MRNLLLFIILIFVVFLGYYYKNSQPDIINIDLPEVRKYQDFVENKEIIKEDKIIIKEDVEETEVNNMELATSTEEEIINDKAKEEEVEEIVEEIKLSSINLDVPFTPQAPTANWEQPFQDACEEASLLMVDYYYQDKELPSKSEIEDILSSMVNWQEENWGGHFNLPTSKLLEYVNNFYDYRAEVVEISSAQDIEKFLDQGIPVIVPADGHKLDNPFFSGDGPEYHMLVVKGYSNNNFITNDPGTRRGEDFIYSYQNLYYSIFDWDTKKSSTTGPKNILILYNN